MQKYKSSHNIDPTTNMSSKTDPCPRRLQYIVSLNYLYQRSAFDSHVVSDYKNNTLKVLDYESEAVDFCHDYLRNNQLDKSDTLYISCGKKSLRYFTSTNQGLCG